MKIYEFGPFRLEPAERRLRREGVLLPLTPKALDTLVVLVQEAGRAVGKDELMERVWPGVNVAEATLAQNVFALRKAFGDEPFIETVPKFGYRFVAPVREVPREAGKIVLLVRPFENLSGDADQEYFSDGLTDEMIAQLGRLNPERLGVIARTSAMRYKGTTKTIQQIGRELGVSYALEGTVRRAGERVRVTAQLVDAADQTHVWTESYDRTFDDILVLQRDLAHAVAREIRVKLAPGAASRLPPAPVSPPAREAYLKGRYFWNRRTEDALGKGIAHFQEAITRDPRCAAAYDGLADSYVMLACRGVLPARETFRKARAAVLTALEIDSELGEGYATLAHLRLHDWDWSNLDDDFQRALALNPGHAFAYYWYGEYLMAMGRVDESVTMVAAAHAMDPLSPVLNAALGMTLYLARRYEQAVTLLHEALEIDAGHFLLHLRLGLTHAQTGAAGAAIDEMRAAVSLSGGSTETRAGLAQAYAAAGRQAQMAAIVRELEEEAGVRYVSPYNLARVHAAAGLYDAAFDQLERAFLERNPDLIELTSDPVFDAMRPDPRLADLRRRIGWTA